MKKRIPYIFLGILALIIVFLGGIRYGKDVKTTDKAISLILSITPVKQEVTGKPISIIYNTYTLENCGVSFVLPSTLGAGKKSSSSAELDSPSGYVKMSCDENAKPTELKEATSASLVFKDEKITASEGAMLNTQEKLFTFNFENPENDKVIYITISTSLYPLFEKSLEFRK